MREEDKKFLLTIKRNNNDYLPLEWHLTSFYQGEDLTTLKGIDKFTTKITRAELINEILEENMVVVKPNESYVFKNLEFQTVPAYNIHRRHHKKEDGWVGYIVTLDQVIYYITGDTDVLRDMKEIHCDILFLPVGGTYTMDCIEAANLCNIIKPKLAIPIHYGYVVGSRKDAEVFKKRLHKEIACKIMID